MKSLSLMQTICPIHVDPCVPGSKLVQYMCYGHPPHNGNPYNVFFPKFLFMDWWPPKNWAKTAQVLTMAHMESYWIKCHKTTKPFKPRRVRHHDLNLLIQTTLENGSTTEKKTLVLNHDLVCSGSTYINQISLVKFWVSFGSFEIKIMCILVFLVRKRDYY